MKTVFGILFRVLAALLAVGAILAALWYYEDRRSGYIEIYNDEDDEGDFEG